MSTILPTTFIVHTTYRCPLTCAHCCFSSGPKVADGSPLGDAIAAIQALGGSTIRLIVFTGGEPFLLGDKLVEAVRLSGEMGFETRVVTSAYWAKTIEGASARLQPFKSVGLTELSISWDDYHESQRGYPITFDFVRNAIAAARRLDIRVGINVVTGEASTWTAELVRQQLGNLSGAVDVVSQSPLNKTGRAAVECKDSVPSDQSNVGPCLHVLRGPTLGATGKLLACCGVTPEISQLVIDPSPQTSTVSERISEASSNPLLLWLFLEGPYAVIKAVNEELGRMPPPASQFGGNCEACHYLFLPDTALSEEARRLAEQRQSELESSAVLFEALGIIGANNANSDIPLQSFWT